MNRIPHVGLIAIVLLALTGCSGEESGDAAEPQTSANPPPDALAVGCQDNVFKLGFKEGEDHWINCPQECQYRGLVHGTDIYTADSAICKAAIHAGVIDAAGGPVHVVIGGSHTGFEGTERNGVTTKPHGEFVTTFTFEQ